MTSRSPRKRRTIRHIRKYSFLRCAFRKIEKEKSGVLKGTPLFCVFLPDYSVKVTVESRPDWSPLIRIWLGLLPFSEPAA